MRLEFCQHCGQIKPPPIFVDEERQQISRHGAPPIVALSRTQTRLLAALVSNKLRPLHDDRLMVLLWPMGCESDDPKQLLKVHAWQTNIRLAAINLMIRRIHGFGYALVEAPQPEAMLVQQTAEDISAHV